MCGRGIFKIDAERRKVRTEVADKKESAKSYGETRIAVPDDQLGGKGKFF